MRKTKSITITDEGRDKGKQFVLTEMPALDAERWAARALIALINSGLDIPEEAVGQGMAALAAVGVNKILTLRYAEIEPLLQDMLACVKIKPTSSDPRTPMWADEIEEVPTLFTLRREVLMLHLSFLPPAVLSRLTSSLNGRAGLLNAQTSPPASQPSSRAA